MPATEQERKYWVGCSLVAGIGPGRVRRLLDHFGSLAEAWRGTPAELAAAGLDQRAIAGLAALQRSGRLDPEIERLDRLGIRTVIWDDPDYPARLRDIYAPPPLLYVRGELGLEDEPAVAIVGTRRASAYGREVAERFGEELGRSRVTVVSGLAKGIDTAAHRGALRSGRTVAVLGSGVDVIYPPENARLAAEILERGAIVSEYPLGTKPEASNFPPRNRIISGVSLGVLVVEAGDASGAQITVNFALEQNRDVFAVPGSIFSPLSRGTNRLIQEGAKLITCCDDVLEELNLRLAPARPEMAELVPATELERLLLRHLSAEPLHIDEVRRESGLPIATVSSTLAMLELRGLVRPTGGMHYVLAGRIVN